MRPNNCCDKDDIDNVEDIEDESKDNYMKSKDATEEVDDGAWSWMKWSMIWQACHNYL
jgi:hypothetical protein